MQQREFEAVALDGDSYTVVQSLIRNKYAAYDEEGEVVLRGKQKMFKLKEQFPFTDADGNEAFEVNAGGIIDVAGNYVISDSQTGEDVVVLDNDFSIFKDSWRISDPDTDAIIATITSRGALTTLARNSLPFGELIPHKYEIADADGTHVGTISGQLSIKDKYDITIDDASSVPVEPVVAAAMVIDAIQGN